MCAYWGAFRESRIHRPTRLMAFAAATVNRTPTAPLIAPKANPASQIWVRDIVGSPEMDSMIDQINPMTGTDHHR